MADGDLTLNDNPNVDTGYVESGGKLHQVHLTRQLNGTLELNDDNYNVDTGYVTVNGKKHRVHLVADLGNGGGGGSVDESKVIVLSGTIPTADANSFGKFYCYKGTTNQNYTHGYVYECVKGDVVYTGTASFEPASLSGTTVACSGDDFANFLTESGVVPLSVVSGTMTYDESGSLWVLVGKDENDETVLTFQEYQQDYEDFGFTFTGTPQDGDVIAFTCTVEESSATYTWTRINLQPGSEHDLGFFDTVAELQTAHPTGSAGDFALIGATDTFWVWDTSTNAWVDSHKADAVTSVNGQTGAVTLTASDVGAATSAQGAKADTAVQPSDLATVATTGLYSDLTGTPTIPDAVQFSTMPTASVDYLGRIVEFTGTTDANYTNGYFYKCVSDGQEPATYSWTRVDVQPGSSLPSQTGNAGKFLTTDGTDASWSDKPLVNLKAGVNSNEIIWVDPSKTSVSSSSTYGLVIGKNANIANYGIAIGTSANAGFGCLSVGESANSSSRQYAIAIGYACSCQADLSLAIGYNASARGRCSIQLGNTDWQGAINNDANTFKVANLNGNFEIMSADGTIPTDRFTTTPSADGSYVPNLSIASGTPTRSWASLLDILSSVSGYDATKTQTLKNVAGTLTWVDD